jgi:methylated-DNA-[protein]-cysteine S-methyltransferase
MKGNNMHYRTTYSSPIGELTLASDKDNLIGLWMEGQKYHGDAIFKDMVENDDIRIFHETKKWLERYFSGKKPHISELSLAPIGGEFRQMVWSILANIPYGKIITYRDIANTLTTKMNKERMSPQAVGGAVGHNPISIIIPCHRVVGANGSLIGYAGGVATKMKLLELEGVDISKLHIPQKGTAL